MTPKLTPPWAVLFLATLVLASFCDAVTTGQFDTCNEVVHSILNGTLAVPGPLGEINNTTIYEFGYMYLGPVMYLKSSCPRSEFLTLTLEGEYLLPNSPAQPLISRSTAEHPNRLSCPLRSANPARRALRSFVADRNMGLPVCNPLQSPIRGLPRAKDQK